MEFVGGITTSDISLANASNAIILAFNVRADKSARELAASMVLILDITQ